MVYMEEARSLNCTFKPEKRRPANLGKKIFCAACVVPRNHIRLSAENGGPVARGKAPFLCSFLCRVIT